MNAIVLAVFLVIGTAIAAPEPDPQFFGGGNPFAEFPFGGGGGPFGFVNDIFSNIAAGKGGLPAPISVPSVQDGYRGDDVQDNNFRGFSFDSFFKDFFGPPPSKSSADNSADDGSYSAPPPPVAQASAFAGPAPPSSTPAPITPAATTTAAA
ncbi:hypothetical protein JTE90_020446 [Oedothorax gibbosus]|uniref:Uncharacterized protein n=1 Tax=Oedothorax gibbosus TaxID=931172 RepID=A0AAV6U0J0_9ARAC|nr:hypothetical protein JTE90_020446 [Oedothorax gibbosus]